MKKIIVILFPLLFLPLSFYCQTTVTLTSVGTSSFTVPAGVTSLTVECWGAGGAGGGTAGNASAAGGGGGGGAYSRNTIAVTSGSIISYTIGAGGNGATGNGANGGSTSFSTVSANGGQGGFRGNSNIGAGGAGGTGGLYNGGNGANGILSTSGGGGGSSAGSASNGNNAIGGTGAGAVTNGAPGANGGVGYVFTFIFLPINVGNNGSAAANPGGGGGGADNGDFGFFGYYYSGGDGGDGQIKVTYPCPTYSLTNTSAASVNVCAGNSSIISLTSTAIGLPVGLYSVDYEVQGVAQTAAAMNVTTAGTGTFIASGFASIGTRTVKITRITSQSCYTDIIANNLTTVTVNSSLSAPTALAGSGATCTQITANWNAISGATYYELDVATDSGFTSFVTGYNALNVGNVLFRNITGLTSGITYYYRVRAFNGTCISANSATITYATTATPGAPSGLNVIVNSCDELTVGWSAGSGAATYEIQWSTTASNFATILGTATGITGLTYTITGLTNGTAYRYRIRSVNSCNSSGYTTSASVTLSGSVPTRPSSISASGALCNQFTVTWPAGTGATSYRVEWSINNFTTVLGSVSGITALTYTITGLTSSTAYYYRVWSENGCGLSSNVRTGASTISTLAAAPALPGSVTVAAGSVLCTQFTVSWTAASGATSYTVEWALNAGFTSGLVSNTGVTGTSFIATGLTPGTQYYYRVRAVSSCGSSAFVNGTPTSRTTSSTVPSTPTISTPDAIPFCQTDSATLTSSLGTTYLWSTGETTASIFVTTAGNYTVQVTNASGCQSASSAIKVVTVHGLPTATAGGSQSICSNGTATVSGAASTNGTILWSHNGTGTLSGQTTLTPTYTPAIGDEGNTVTLTMTVTSNNTCAPQIATATYTILVNARPLQPTLSLVAHPGCSTNGSFTISNYNAAYTYAVSPSTGVTISGDTVNAPAGTYTLTASSAFCTSAASSSITMNAQPVTPVQPTLGSVTQPTCSVATGNFSITNYNASYTYAVTPSIGVTVSGSTITAPAGTYTVTATLAACTSLASAGATLNVQPATPVQPTLSSVTQTTCAEATGSFSITNYDASYTYAVSPSTGVTISGSTITAPAGTYTVTAILGTCTSVTSASATVDVQINNTWSGTAWSTGFPPTYSEKIIFDGPYTSSSNLTGCSCQVNSGAIVTISSANTLDIINSVTVVSGGSLTFEDSASLVQTNDAAVNSGNITYKRRTTPLKQYDYTYWSSPVTSAPLSQLATNSLFYNFSPPINNWVYQAGSVVMAPGVGYIGRAPGNLIYSPTQIVETSFVGVPNNGAITTSIIKDTGTYNLIGNPYPSAIDGDLFITANAGVTNGTVYFWTHNTAITSNVYTINDYAKYNLTGSTSTSTAAVGGSVFPTGKIAAGQGFFIEAKTSLANGTYTATFDNTMRITDNNTQFFKNETPATTTNSISEGLERHRVWLSLRSSLGAYNQMLLGYVEGATNDFDSLFDGKTFAVGNSVSIYTMTGTENLAIQGKALPFSETDIIPIGYSTTLNGELSINLDDFDGLFTNQNVYLLDKTANILHDIKASPYTFITTSGNFTDRFELRYTDTTLGTSPVITANDIKIITNNGQFEVLSPASIITKVQVYDILGKLLFAQNALNTNLFQTNSLNIAPQVLLVKVTLDNQNTYTKKVLME